MTLLLLTLTAISLMLALAMGSLLLQVRRADRRRSAARSALLRAAAGIDEIRQTTHPAVEQVSEPGDPDVPGPRGQLFALGESTASWPLRAAAGIVLILAIAVAWLSPRPPSPAAGAETTRAAHGDGTLELIELGHTARHDGLTITGAARNPPGAPRLLDVTVVATAYDAAGREVARGRGALEPAALAPGTISPFVVKMASAGAVSRYRVSFHGADGRVIAHVDRRPAPASASLHGTTGRVPWVR